ncbi:MAG: hypothetical protein V5A44_07255 [Haloarculaceae archaeon]
MNLVSALVARERRSDALALRTASRAGSYSYEKLCTNAWKAGNLLAHYGVRGDATVAVDADLSLSPPPITASLGAGLLGASVRFDPPRTLEARALVVPAARVGDYDVGPGTTVLAYGDEPDETGVTHFEREVWSENPTMPPDSPDPEADFLLAADRRVTQREALEAVERVVAEYGLGEEDLVAPRAPLADPGVVVAGVLAPLAAGGAVLLDESATGTMGVGSEDAVPEGRRVDPATVW